MERDSETGTVGIAIVVIFGLYQIGQLVGGGLTWIANHV
jgi:hypothetical protein